MNMKNILMVVVGKKKGINKSEIDAQTILNYKNHNVVRSNMIRRLACSNFSNKSTFLTLTFKDNLTNVKEANILFKAFIRRLKKFIHPVELKYLAVIEFQERGAVHYHVLLNLEFIDFDKISEIWGNGFVFINKIRHVDNVGAYIIKYMTKDNKDTRLMGLPAYLRSRNLKEPKKFLFTDIDNEHHLEYIDKLENIESKKIYSAEYDTEFTGKCVYTQYNLNRGEI